MTTRTTFQFDAGALDVLLSQIHEGIIVTDADGDFLYTNDAADRLLESSSADVRGVIGRTLLVGETVRDEEIAHAFGAERCCLRLNASPLRNAAGVVEMLIVTLADVTSEKSVQELTPMLRSLACL